MYDTTLFGDRWELFKQKTVHSQEASKNLLLMTNR